MKQCMRKITILLMICAMIFNTLQSAMASSDNQESSDISEIISTLYGLDIFEGDADGDFRGEENITRSEFALILCKLLGLEVPEDEMQTSTFKDVQPTDFTAGSIKLVNDMGIINGYGDGRFGPEDPVTYEQAVKMLVSVLGYKVYAENKGGYPVGYMLTGIEKGICKGTGEMQGSNAKRSTVAKLIYNSLDVDMMQQTGFGGQIKYSVEHNKTILSEKLDVEKEEGRIVATGDTSLVGVSPVGPDEVMIDRKIFKVGDSNIKNYLGYTVTYYAKKEESSNIIYIKYFAVKENGNTIIRVNSDDIDNSTTKRKFVYWEDKDHDDKPKEVTLSTAVDVVFNGRAFAAYTDSDFKPSNGKVVLIDSDNDDKYDTALINSYQTKVVDFVSTGDKNVYCKYNSSAIEIEGDNTEVNVFKEGKIISFKDLQQWNVLSVAESKSPGTEKLINIYVSEKSIKGKISETDDDKVIIDGMEYTILPEFIGDIPVDTTATYYLDILGNIAACDKSVSSEVKYGYLIKAERAKGLSDFCKFKLLNESGKIVTLSSANTIKIDGTNYTEKSEMLNALKNYNTNYSNQIEGLTQVIRYSVNRDGNIDFIDTSKAGTNEDVDNNSVSLDLNKTAQLQYKSSAMSFGLQFITTSKTIFFFAPIDKNDESGYRVKKLSDYINDNKYDLMAFNCLNGKPTKVVVEEGAGLSATISESTPIALVDKVTTIMTNDGEISKKLYCFSEGKSVGLNVSEDVNLDVAQGDVIRYKLDDNKVIIAYQKVFDYNNSDTSATLRPAAGINENQTAKFNEYRVVYGQVYARNTDSDAFVISPGLTYQTKEVYKLGKVPVYMYDHNNEKVSIAAKEDLLDYVKQGSRASKVVVHTRYAELMSVVIYK